MGTQPHHYLNKKSEVINMTSTPLVSVLMTAYNRELFLPEAIESVLKSTYENWELIIVDDASKDDTVSIARAYASRDGRIKVYVNEANLGDYPNRNKAARMARGKYIVFTDSDDWMFENALVKWVELIEKKQAKFGIFVPEVFAEPCLVEPETTIRLHFFEKPLLMFGPVATIVANNYFKEINGFPEKYGPANDMYYNLKAAAGTATLFFPFPLNDYRRHDGQEINNQFSYLYNSYRYLNDALREIDLKLNKPELKYLNHKNKRRFVTNCFQFLIKTKDIGGTVKVVRKARFTLGDFFMALYNINVKN